MELNRKERPCSSKFKKRNRKDLSPEEIEEIVKATKQPYRMQKDIAQQFRITAHLVSGLVLESKRQPEKLKKTR